MSSIVRKAAGAALAAVIFGIAVTATATPSAAQGWRGGRGGWHGAGWHGGYWRGGRGYGWGGPFAAGVVGGLAVGAVAASAYPYGSYYGPAYGGGCSMQNQPSYDPWGNFVGYQAVYVCY